MTDDDQETPEEIRRAHQAAVYHIHRAFDLIGLAAAQRILDQIAEDRW